MYRPLNVHPGAPERVKRFVAEHVDMQFHDVHCMLRLPMPRYRLRSGCNFAAGTCLLGLIAGASIMLYEPDEFGRRGNRGGLFREVLKSYPWLEEGSAMDPEVAIDKLWEMYRNPFAHSLGVPHPGPELFKVIKFREGLSERQVEALERPGPRPDWLPPTMIQQENSIKLHVDALYWGTRRMVEELTADPDRMERTDELLTGLDKGVQPTVAMASSVLPSPPRTVVSSGGMATIDAVTGEISVAEFPKFPIVGPTE
jgi:hypothetical protein